MADGNERAGTPNPPINAPSQRVRSDDTLPTVLQRLIDNDFRPAEILAAARHIETHMTDTLALLPKKLDDVFVRSKKVPDLFQLKHRFYPGTGNMEIDPKPLSVTCLAGPSFLADKHLQKQVCYKPWENHFRPDQIVLSGRVHHPSPKAFQEFEEHYNEVNDHVAYWIKIRRVLGSEFDIRRQVTPYGIFSYITPIDWHLKVHSHANYVFLLVSDPAQELAFRPYLDENRPDRITIDGKHAYPTVEGFEGFADLWMIGRYYRSPGMPVGPDLAPSSVLIWKEVEAKLGARAYFDPRMFARDTAQNIDPPHRKALGSFVNGVPPRVAKRRLPVDFNSASELDKYWIRMFDMPYLE